jgi:hypothetical protein
MFNCIFWGRQIDEHTHTHTSLLNDVTYAETML